MSLPLPEDWVEDADYLDARRSIGNLACPRYVVFRGMGPGKGYSWRSCHQPAPGVILVPGVGTASGFAGLLKAKKCTSWWPETTEMVLVGEILTQIRNQALDIDAAATNHAVQTQALQAKNLAVKALAQHLVDCLRQKIESQDRIHQLESQLGDLQQQLQRQKELSWVARTKHLATRHTGSLYDRGQRHF